MSEKINEPLASLKEEREIKAYLNQGETITCSLRLPKNLKDSVTREAKTNGIGFSAYVRLLLINELVEKNL